MLYHVSLLHAPLSVVRQILRTYIKEHKTCTTHGRLFTAFLRKFLDFQYFHILDLKFYIIENIFKNLVTHVRGVLPYLTIPVV